MMWRIPSVLLQASSSSWSYWGRSGAAAAVACTALLLTARMDASPALYVYDLLCMSAPPFSSFQRRQQRRQRRLSLYFGNRHVWITGASSGIGRELAHQLSTAGASLTLSSRNQPMLEQVAQECRTRGASSCHVLVMDVCSDEATLEDIVRQPRLQDVDCVILNAGIGSLALASQTTTEQSTRMWQVNTLAPIVLTQLLLRHPWSQSATVHSSTTTTRQQQQQRRRQRPHLVVLSSVASQFPVPLSAAYASSKHAVHGYFSSLRAEGPHDQLRIDLPCPGPVQTNFHDNHKHHHAAAAAPEQTQQTATTTTAIPTTTSSAATTTSITTIQERELKMPVSRCAQLLLSSMVMKHQSLYSSFRGHDCTIAQQPTLFFGALHRHVPWLSRWFIHTVIGPTRVGMYRQGLDVYDPVAIRAYRRHMSQQQQQSKTTERTKPKKAIGGGMVMTDEGGTHQ